MKKALVLTLIMVLAVAGIASAEAKLGGELKVEYVVNTDNQRDDEAGTGKASVPLKLKVTAEEEGVWSIKADLKANANKGDVTLGDWSMNLTDELFVADLWGGDIEKDGVKTPMEFVSTGDDVTADGEVARLRLTSDIMGYADLTLDYHPNELFVFASKALDDVTVGGAVQKDLSNEDVKGAAHVKYVYGPATLTGEVGIDRTEGKDKDNTLLGGKVSYALNDQITLKGKVTHKAKNAGDELLLEAGADYVQGLFKVGGTYTWKDDLDTKETKATNKLKANVTFRSNEDVDFGDLFDDYHTLTGYAAFAEAAYTTAKDIVGDKEPLMEVTLKGAATAVPDMVWVKGEFVYKSDKDETAKDEDFDFIKGNNSLTEDVVLNAKDYYRLTAESTVKLTEKVKVIPAVKYAKWNNMTVTDQGDIDLDEDDPRIVKLVAAKEMTDLELGAALTYALSDSSEIGVSYTDRTQKTTTPDEELKDGFAKVYFKTSF
jgi:hypothetical protein